MDATPPAKSARKTPQKAPRTPQACPYRGITFAVPGSVFEQPDVTYKATVKGYNGRKTNELICKFDDGSQYWFPIEDVLKWMGPSAARQAAAAAAGSSPPVSPRSGRRAGSSSLPDSPRAAADGPRRRTTRAAAAAAGDGDLDEAGGTADEVFEMPLLAKGEPQPGSTQQLQRQPSNAELQQQTNYAGGIVVGILLLLIVMVLAIAGCRPAAHDLRAWLDRISGLGQR